MTKPIYYSLSTAAYGSLICLIQFRYWHPYCLTGPQFLQYYAAILLTAYIALLIFKNNTMAKLENAAISMFLFLAALGVARLVQGIVNNKPVGYLLLMLLFHLIVIAVIKFQNRKGSK